MIYTDGIYAYQVSQGIGNGPWMTVKQLIGTTRVHRVKSKNLPLRDSRELAEKDLKAYAERYKMALTFNGPV